ncbi:MAG TPA: Gfo/Idh/MocA family oxidoreductase [Chthonomonadaceae bacterium]|nr:Gfo/Idh/MocA family oxidoreductase [Chthonomonadaceae bacterium]
MTRLNVAIVGCGDISGRHIAAYRHYGERARIAACCDTDPERAQRAAEQAQDDGARVVTDFYELLQDPGVDAVNLCLPHHLHADMTVAAAEAGKHILCEKPLALTPEECDRMIAAARAAGVVLMHGEPMRTAGNIERAAEIVREGRIGKRVGLQATFAYWQRAELNTDWRGRNSQSGGGHLMDGGIHIVDAMRQVGGEAVSVQAMTQTYRPELGDGEDLAAVNIRYTEGHVGQIFACHATRGRGASPLMTVFGTEGCLTLDAWGGEKGLMLFLPGKEPEVLVGASSWNAGYERLLGHFLDVIQQGIPLRATPEDGRENVRLVLAAYESARTRREVAL